MNKFLGMLVVLSAMTLPALLASAARAADDGDEVDVSEVIRRGNSVVRVDGFMSAEDLAATSALGPPADDSHRWFITILTKENCPHCDKLMADVYNNPILKAWINARDPKKSWCHFNVYKKEDATQEFRWKQIAVKGYPTILLQPPRNWDFGNPATVVLQRTGYTDAQALSDDLSKAIYAYVAKLRQEGRMPMHREDIAPQKPAGGATAAKGGFRAGPEAEGGKAEGEVNGYGQAPFTPGPNTPFNPIELPNIPNPLPSVPVAPVAPAAPTNGTLGQLLSLAGTLMSGSGFSNILLVILSAIQAFRTVMQLKGHKLLLDDATYAKVVDTLKKIVTAATSVPPGQTPTT